MKTAKTPKQRLFFPSTASFFLGGRQPKTVFCLFRHNSSAEIYESFQLGFCITGKNRFTKWNSEHIRFIIRPFKENITSAQNIRKYTSMPFMEHGQNYGISIIGGEMT